MSLAYRALKCPFVVSLGLGLNGSEPHWRAAYEASRPVYGSRI